MTKNRLYKNECYPLSKKGPNKPWICLYCEKGMKHIGNAKKMQPRCLKTEIKGGKLIYHIQLNIKEVKMTKIPVQEDYSQGKCRRCGKITTICTDPRWWSYKLCLKCEDEVGEQCSGYSW